VHSPEPAPGRSSDADERRFIDVGEVRLRVSVRGSGDPLLLITGIGASLELAEPFETEMVARGFQVISFDAPGVGQSTGYRFPHRMPGIARTIEQLLDALGLQRVDVLGVSLGGVIAQQLAQQAPGRVRRLVLAATGAGVVGLGGVPGSPRALVEMATPRRYRSPDHYRSMPGGSTAVQPGTIRTRCCTTRWPGSPGHPPSPATSGSCTRSASGPACRGCAG
jgi:pimeloyl-ACP methyl ester carboxylesterase